MMDNSTNIDLFIGKVYNQEFGEQGSSRLLSKLVTIEANIAHNFVDSKYHPYLGEALNLLTCFWLYRKSYALNEDDLSMVITKFCNKSPAFGNAMMGFYGVQKLAKSLKLNNLNRAITAAGSNTWRF